MFIHGRLDQKWSSYVVQPFDPSILGSPTRGRRSSHRGLADHSHLEDASAYVPPGRAVIISAEIKSPRHPHGRQPRRRTRRRAPLRSRHSRKEGHRSVRASPLQSCLVARAVGECPRRDTESAAVHAVTTVLHGDKIWSVFLFERWRGVDNGSHGRLAIQRHVSCGPAVSTPSQNWLWNRRNSRAHSVRSRRHSCSRICKRWALCRLEIPADWLSSDAQIGDASRGFDLEQTVYRN